MQVDHERARGIAALWIDDAERYGTANAQDSTALARAYLDLRASVEAYMDLHGCKHDRLRSEAEMFEVTKALVALRACLSSPQIGADRG